jgi:DNA invertase Pin-like site-specific DNA recombinase
MRREPASTTTTANPGDQVFDAAFSGYARVSTADHQIDTLRRAGVAHDDIYLDHASGAKASRPQLDNVLRLLLRDGDTLKITRLDRLGRSVLHLVTLGAELRERGVGLHVIEQGIDTTAAEGRAMFGMLSVLAELEHELIVANTRDGLAAARARGRKADVGPSSTRADRARTAVLRRRRAHRPTDRRYLQRPAHHRLRASRGRQQGQATSCTAHCRGRLTSGARRLIRDRGAKWRLVTRFLPAPRPGGVAARLLA